MLGAVRTLLSVPWEASACPSALRAARGSFAPELQDFWEQWTQSSLPADAVAEGLLALPGRPPAAQAGVC